MMVGGGIGMVMWVVSKGEEMFGTIVVAEVEEKIGVEVSKDGM